MTANRESIATEITILKNVTHSNVIKLHNVFESKRKIYLIMELYVHSLCVL